MSETIVIFRKDRTGWKDRFALFPELPSDNYGHLCTAYQHVGQHCAADYHGCIAHSDPATPSRVRRPLRGTGTAGIHPDRPPAGHARDARASSSHRRRTARAKVVRETAPGDHGMNDDPTEAIRRRQLAEINARPGSREALEAEHGQVWDTQAVGSRTSPCRASWLPTWSSAAGRTGSGEASCSRHNPRFYFVFEPYRE